MPSGRLVGSAEVDWESAFRGYSAEDVVQVIVGHNLLNIHIYICICIYIYTPSKAMRFFV